MCAIFLPLSSRPGKSLSLNVFFKSFLSTKACMTDDVCQGSLPDVCNEEGYDCNIECCSTDLCNGLVEVEGGGEGRNYLP